MDYIAILKAGAQAQCSGKCLTDCPYGGKADNKSKSAKITWEQGWHGSRRGDLNPLFESRALSNHFS